MISVYRADQLKRFAPFSYLNHSFILSLNVKVCIRFIVFLQISLCFFICQELCWMRGLCISFTFTCFCFQSEEGGGGGRVKSLRTGGGGQGGKKIQDLEGYRFEGVFLLGRSVPRYMSCLLSFIYYCHHMYYYLLLISLFIGTYSNIIYSP